MKHRFLRLLSGLLIGAAILSLCACDEEREPAAGMQFKTVLTAEPTSLDPQVAVDNAAVSLICNLFEGLTRVDDTGAVLPGVATHWVRAQNNTVYTFTLRTDACWSDGTPVTAQDFVFGILRALNPGTHAPDAARLFGIVGAEAYYNGEGDAADIGITTEGDYTIRFALNAPDEQFDALCALPVCMPCNETFFRRTAGAYGMSAEATLGNGPFCFRAKNGWLEGDYLYLIRNKHYVGSRKADAGSVYLRRKPLTEVTDALEKGELHLLEIEPSMAEAVQAVESFDYETVSYGVKTVGLFFHTADALFASADLRTLLLRTVHRADFDGMASAGQQRSDVLIPSATVWNGKSYRAQAGKSVTLTEATEGTAAQMKELLAQMGVSGLSGVTVLFEDTPQNRQAVNVFITAWYQAFGYYINMEPVTAEEYAQRVRSGNFQIAFGAVTAGANDPFSFLESVVNLTRYTSETQAEWLTGRTNMLLHAQMLEEELLTKGAFYPIFEAERCWAMRVGMTELELNPFSGAIYFRSAKR